MTYTARKNTSLRLHPLAISVLDAVAAHVERTERRVAGQGTAIEWVLRNWTPPSTLGETEAEIRRALKEYLG